jgi:PhnB protein
MTTVTPYLTVRDAARAIEFYKKALGAIEMGRVPGPDGKRLIHAALKIGDSMVFLGDESPEAGAEGTQSPLTLGNTTVTIHLQTDDADQMMASAVAAGAQMTMPVADMFWGDRYGRFKDPFGHQWSLGTTQRKLSYEEMQVEMKKAFAKQP